jgi:glycosyltransferase involved in cell wall biosynthesis
MKILSIAAGAGGMYCGSCLRDNALAAELLSRGHDVTLLPLYTPLLSDEPNVSQSRVLFGGISVYLQQRSAMFRGMPRLFDRFVDAPRVIKAFADRSVSTDPRLLGGLTVSMLEGADGFLAKEFEKLIEWTSGEQPPDVVNLTNSLLIGLARPLVSAFRRPVCCTLQGEDLFLANLQEPYRTSALGLIRRQVPHVDRFIAVSEYYAGFMAHHLEIPSDRISVVPLGINLTGFDGPRRTEDGLFRVGYFARVAPEKGLRELADAYTMFRQRTPGERVRLEAAGYMAASDRPYLLDIQQQLERAGLGGEFTYHGVVDRAQKASFLQSLDVLSVPATYDEPKGFPLLEAMACGVPVVQPRRGSFTEIVTKTGGGILVDPESAKSLADGLFQLWKDAGLRHRLGQQGLAGVRAHYTIQHSADRLTEVYKQMVLDRRPDV